MNKLRSALTMLGIIIGVGAVIAMVGVGAGAQARVAEQIQSLGSNLIIVLSGSSRPPAASASARAAQLTITEDDAAAIAREVPAVQVGRAVGARHRARSSTATSTGAPAIQGVTADYFEARDWAVDDGRPFAPEDVDGAAKVALLGQTTALNLFGDADPARPDHPDQEGPVHGDRRARPQGPELAGARTRTTSSSSRSRRRRRRCSA